MRVRDAADTDAITAAEAAVEAIVTIVVIMVIEDEMMADSFQIFILKKLFINGHPIKKFMNL